MLLKEMTEKDINRINKFIEGKTFVYDHYVRFNNDPVKVYYQFHIDGVKRLISIGEWKDHLFISVKIVNGEGMVNLYLTHFKNQRIAGRESVSNNWFEFSVQTGQDIESFLKFFNINMNVVIDTIEFEPNEDFVSLVNLDNSK
jgi:predicted ATP-dependent Lon-type protease